MLCESVVHATPCKKCEITYILVLTCVSDEYRLAGGSSCSEGNVELRRAGGSWGLVCDDDWGTSDALVVCSLLGFRWADFILY